MIRVRAMVGPEDGLAVIGLALVAGGTALWSTEVALVLTGAILLLVSVIAAIRRSTRRPRS